MDRLLSALSWSGTDVMLSMFVVSPRTAAPALDLPDAASPHRLREYELHDESGVLGGHHVYEYDLIFDDVPSNIDRLVIDCLRSALGSGAVAAWFGFEGSFDFHYILHPDVAGQVYAVAAYEMVRLALDDEYRLSDAWRELLAEIRRNLWP